MRKVYSHSRLASFENCPKQFYFRYVAKIPEESEGVEAFVGKRVHEVLERLYHFIERQMVPSIEQVVHRYHQLWEETLDPSRIRIVREGTPLEFYRQLGERCLRNFYRAHYPFDADETLAIEEHVEFDLDPAGRYPMRGIIDRLVRARDGAIEIHDYKTGARVPSQDKLDRDRQLALYELGVRERFGSHPTIRLVWHYVASNQLRTSTRTPEQLGELRDDTIRLIDRVEAESEFPTRKIPLCSWCEYRRICPAWNADAPSTPVPQRESGSERAPEATATYTQLRLL